MKKTKKAAALILAAALMLGLPSCKKDQPDPAVFPDVVTKGIPDEGEPESEIKQGDFYAELYANYAVITEYDGSDRSVSMPKAVGGRDVLAVGSYCFAGNDSVEEVILPSGIRVIEKGAFEDCVNLKSVTLPDTLETISDFAFRYTALSSIELPDSVAYIGMYAFYLTHIESVTIPSGVSTIERYAFYGIQELKTVKLSERLSSIGERAFGGCRSLKTVEIYENVASFGDYCFSDCVSLESLRIPEKAKSFGNAVFNGCTNLTLQVKKNSEAAKYADKNGYRYDLVK